MIDATAKGFNWRILHDDQTWQCHPQPSGLANLQLFDMTQLSISAPFTSALALAHVLDFYNFLISPPFRSLREMSSEWSDIGSPCPFDDDFWLSQVSYVDEGPDPIETIHDEKVVSHEQEEEGESTSSLPADVAPHPRIRRGPNITPKGKGKDSKTESPDRWDSYNYQAESIAFRGLQDIGYKGIAPGSLWKVMDKVHEGAMKRGIAELLTTRNRMARRRRPCAFHWFDENWCLVEEIFKTAVQEVLGNTSGVKPRGRPTLHFVESNL
jgi:hypothetical protein